MDFVPSAIVLINADLDHEDLVTDKLKEIDGITEVYKVHGVYDIVVKVEAQTMARVKEIISKKLRKISDVRSTITMMVTMSR
jgi:DNA-binding Lrp family transcriptional regulator